MRESLANSEKETDEIGFVPSALVNLEESIAGATTDAVEKFWSIADCLNGE